MTEEEFENASLEAMAKHLLLLGSIMQSAENPVIESVGLGSAFAEILAMVYMDYEDPSVRRLLLKEMTEAVHKKALETLEKFETEQAGTVH